jgi:hypothetical protein
MKLYLRQRVEQWIAGHQEEITQSQSRKQKAQKAVHTKREAAKAEIADLVRSLELDPIQSLSKVRKEAAHFFFQCYEDFDGEVTGKGLCSFIRHNYTNYEEILSAVKGKVGASELYENVKDYLCCRIIEHYGLEVNPRQAAFGDQLPHNLIPERFQKVKAKNLKRKVIRILGMEDPS